MTHGALHASAIALGMAAFVSLAPISTASADSSAPSGATSAPNGAAAPTPSGATPSLSEPAPTPGWAEASPNGAAPPASGTTAIKRPAHVYVRHYVRLPHYAWRNGHRYYRYDRDPVAAAATGLVGGVADLGSLAAYPIYCFPRYGSCPFYRPYP